MAVWVVRAGSGGEDEEYALKNNIALVFWYELGNLRGEKKDEIRDLLRRHNRENKRSSDVWASELFKFANNIIKNDYVLLPFIGKERKGLVAIGKVKEVGGRVYQYRARARMKGHGVHQIPVRWRAKDIPRNIFRKDFQLSGRLTIYEIKAKDADKRIENILSLGKDPGPLKTSEPKEPENLPFPASDWEDPTKLSIHKQKERNPALVKAAKSYHGAICQVCGFDFGKFYGELGKGYIEAHHLMPYSQQKEPKKLSPKKDMRVLCANCHRMIHREKNMSLKVLKRIVATNGLART